MGKQTPKKSPGRRKETNIGGNVSKSVIIDGDGNVVNMGGGESAKKSPDPTEKPVKPKMDTAVLVALIGVAGTLIAALLNSPLLLSRINPTPTATVVISATPFESATATEYPTATPIILVVTSTEIPVTPPTPTFTPTLENTVTASTSPEPKADNMTVVLRPTVDEGKAPLRVNFDARSSYAKFSDGNLVPCGNNPFCSYVFAVYRDSRLVEKISDAGGVLSYTFGAKGTYFVTVYVCRGDACGDDGVTVNVK